MVHLWTVASQMWPDVTPPQSVSLWQPQVPPARHWAPLPVGTQAVVLVGVHSTQACVVGEQTWGSRQPASLRHCTHWWGVMLVLHAVVGATQSPLTTHPPAGLQLPTAPVTSLQV
jgi:hypothetical protein